jgi:hypothetical protein
MSARQAQIAQLKKQLAAKGNVSTPVSAEAIGAFIGQHLVDTPVRVTTSFWRGFSEQVQVDHLTRKLGK